MFRAQISGKISVHVPFIVAGIVRVRCVAVQLYEIWQPIGTVLRVERHAEAQDKMPLDGRMLQVITASSSAGGANDILIQDLVIIKKIMFDI